MTSGPGTKMADDQAPVRVLLEEIRDNTRTISVKLFGSSDADNETDKGRLPMVERAAKRAHERVDRLEKRIIFVSAIVAASATGGVLSGKVILAALAKLVS